MSAYATPCPRFGKVNLAQRRHCPANGAASAIKFCFLKKVLQFD
jgi:hypothetical protein